MQYCATIVLLPRDYCAVLCETASPAPAPSFARSNQLYTRKTPRYYQVIQWVFLHFLFCSLLLSVVVVVVAVSVCRGGGDCNGGDLREGGCSGVRCEVVRAIVRSVAVQSCTRTVRYAGRVSRNQRLTGSGFNSDEV